MSVTRIIHATNRSLSMNLEEFSRQLAANRDISPESLDERLQDECIALLANLERLLEELGVTSEAGKQVEVIEYAKEMLVEILEFLSERFGNEAVALEITRVCELRDMAKDVQTLVGKGFFSRMFGAKNASLELKQQAYRQLGEEFAVVFRALLAVIDGNFRTQLFTNEWRASCRVFVDDFRRQW